MGSLPNADPGVAAAPPGSSRPTVGSLAGGEWGQPGRFTAEGFAVVNHISKIHTRVYRFAAALWRRVENRKNRSATQLRERELLVLGVFCKRGGYLCEQARATFEAPT